VTPRIRLFALVGLGAALALAAGFMLLGHSQSSSAAAVQPVVPLHHHAKRAKSHAAAPKPKRAHRAARRTVAHAKPTPRQHSAPAVVNGMPAALAHALAVHRVVVLALYTSGGGVDDEAVNEARAGAKLAGAGFVAVNVANERQARPLLPLLAGAASGADGVLDAPAVLVFQRPKKLFVRLEGFADRDTVAQAATNAAPAPAGALHA
jgi:hypothetical protein